MTDLDNEGWEERRTSCEALKSPLALQFGPNFHLESNRGLARLSQYEGIGPCGHAVSIRLIMAHRVSSFAVGKNSHKRPVQPHWDFSLESLLNIIPRAAVGRSY